MALKTSKKKPAKTNSAQKYLKNLKITKEIKTNLTFGLLLIGLLIAGFSFGAIMGLIDDAKNPQTTTYTREAKAYNSTEVQPINNQNNSREYIIVPKQ